MSDTTEAQESIKEIEERRERIQSDISRLAVRIEEHESVIRWLDLLLVRLKYGVSIGDVVKDRSGRSWSVVNVLLRDHGPYAEGHLLNKQGKPGKHCKVIPMAWKPVKRNNKDKSHGQ